MNNTKLKVVAVSVLLILVAGLQTISFVVANPLVPPLIEVDSPQNNRVYSSGEVWLNFTRLSASGMEGAYVTYSLDGTTETATDGDTLLSGLSAGSHTLALYARFPENEGYGYLMTKIHFSVNYSTQLVTFAAVSSSALAVGLLALFATRHRLATALKKNKAPSFWAGLCVLVLGALLSGLVVGDAAHDYLFPVYSSGLTVKLTFLGLFFGLFFVGAGLLVMRRGVKPKASY